MKSGTKKVIALILTLVLGFSVLSACSNNEAKTDDQSNPSGSTDPNGSNSSGNTDSFDSSKPITVISREDGSGTRSAFIELFGVQSSQSDGSKKDNTTREAIIADKTDVMMTNVANDPYAIGYISLGSMNSTIKALDIDGIAATAQNVKNGTYPIQRPFIIATKGDPTGLTKDFIDYILSTEGQAVVESRGYTAIVDNASPYTGGRPSGRIVIGGSSSVTPLMEVLREEYLKVNPNATIEIQMSDSSAGMSGTMEGSFDIGMASRELKESELAVLKPVEIAKDGIAVIVNVNNPLTNLTKEQVKAIYTGETLNWSELQ